MIGYVEHHVEASGLLGACRLLLLKNYNSQDSMSRRGVPAEAWEADPAARARAPAPVCALLQGKRTVDTCDTRASGGQRGLRRSWARGSKPGFR